MSHLFNTYARLPPAIVRGEGAWLFDAADNRYLDAISGIGVCSLGHAHPRLARVIAEQAATLMHTANTVNLPVQERLGERLSAISGLDKSFIANSGTEAIECALKLARRHGHAQSVENPAVLVTDNSFHGRTLAALSASGNPAIQEGYGPLVDGFVRVPFGDATAVDEAMQQHPEIVAVLVEPIQGESGVRIGPKNYLDSLRALCNRHGALLMLDEIQTGMNRTGHWFAHQGLSEIKPDVMTVAKALGNGMPIGVCLASSEVAGLMSPGSHGSTFGGNPLACRTALEVIDIMEEQDAGARSLSAGNQMLDRLRQGLDDHAGVREIRGRGLMIGIEMADDCGELKFDALEHGVIINVTRGNTVRLLPPLIIDDHQLAHIADTIINIIHKRYGA